MASLMRTSCTLTFTTKPLGRREISVYSVGLSLTIGAIQFILTLGIFLLFQVVLILPTNYLVDLKRWEQKMGINWNIFHFKFMNYKLA